MPKPGGSGAKCGNRAPGRHRTTILWFATNDRLDALRVNPTWRRKGKRETEQSHLGVSRPKFRFDWFKQNRHDLPVNEVEYITQRQQGQHVIAITVIARGATVVVVSCHLNRVLAYYC